MVVLPRTPHRNYHRTIPQSAIWHKQLIVRRLPLKKVSTKKRIILQIFQKLFEHTLEHAKRAEWIKRGLKERERKETMISDRFRKRLPPMADRQIDSERSSARVCEPIDRGHVSGR